MPANHSEGKSLVERLTAALFVAGRAIFALAIIAIGIETWVCARTVSHPLGRGYEALNLIPWLPAIPWLAYLAGAIWMICGAAFFSKNAAGRAAMVLGVLFIVCSLVIVLPRYLAHLGSIPFRTVFLEPIAIGCVALLIPARGAIPEWLAQAGRYLLGMSLVVFGVDHLVGLSFHASFVPWWLPWHTFWAAFFGVAFLAAAVSITFRVLERWGAAGLGLMFGTWVLTLHLPRVLGFLQGGGLRDADEWSSMLIAMALWGGSWAAMQKNEEKDGEKRQSVACATGEPAARYFTSSTGS
jgi:uncharacterized membrane protein YhaH (DUF805 family)